MVPEQFICEILSIGALCFESYHVGRAFVAGHRTRSSKEELTRSPNYYNASFQARCYTYIANPQVLSLANMYPYARGGLHSPIQKCVTANCTDKQPSAVAENNVCYLKDEYIERVHMFQVRISRKPFAFVPCGRNVFLIFIGTIDFIWTLKMEKSNGATCLRYVQVQTICGR